MAALLVERSFVDPRSQVVVNGSGNILNWDVKYLLSDNTRAKVWSAGHLSFALWYASILNVVLFLPLMSKIFTIFYCQIALYDKEKVTSGRIRKSM